MQPPLACTVHGCARPLMREDRRLICAAGHTFDVARSGYISLLQPQDRRSRAPGDSKEAVGARARLLEAGIGRAVIDAIVARAPATNASLVAVDLGCGSGELLGALATTRDVCGIGIDLSTAAAEAAARRFPSLTWLVANADRRLPLLDASVDVVLSLNARRNPEQCARVLKSGGQLIVGVPAHDDLIELRTAVQGEGVERERANALVSAHEPLFSLLERFTTREHHRLEGDTLRALLRSTYRGARASAAARVENLDALDVTVATEVCVLRRAA
ncbi:MAG TPA: methyltransferase domain-containing protein [Vicinamibacterales bacterium]|nr:methyltransferase domain-containing protein [Vicinamibacterales bacterium]